MTDIAIAHKDYDVRGGGEILAEHLAGVLDAPLYVGHGDPDNQPDKPEIDIQEIAPESKIHHLLKRDGVLRAIGHMIQWRDNAPDVLENYETVITSGNETNWWIPTNDEQVIISYTHSTPWFQTNRFDDVDGTLSRTIQQIMRYLYETHMTQPDLWVANSDLVARRIERYWGANPDRVKVVYPPVDTDGLSPDKERTGDYYLSLSRLESVKNVPEIAKAAIMLDKPLKIAGKGEDEREIKDLAGDNVEYLGWVSGDQKAELLSGAKAVITACRNEDFGIVPVEAFASGTPVIGPNASFTKMQINDGENGVLYEDDVTDGIKQFERTGIDWSEDELSEWAKTTFAEERFKDQMKTAIEEAKKNANVTPSIHD